MAITHDYEAPVQERHAEVQRRRRQLAIGAAIASGLLLLIFPLQTILAIILAGSAWIVTMALGVWIERNVEARDRDEVLRHLPHVAAVLVAVGIALAFVWPATMAAVTLLLAVVATACLAFLSSVERKVKAEARHHAMPNAEYEAPESHGTRAA